MKKLLALFAFSIAGLAYGQTTDTTPQAGDTAITAVSPGITGVLNFMRPASVSPASTCANHVDGVDYFARLGSGLSWNGSTHVLSVSVPTPKRQETYTGTTNASGVYAVTYSTAFTNPIISVTLIGGTRTDTNVNTSSTTGFSIKCERRTDIAGLLPTFANIAGLTVNVTVTEN